MLRKLKLYGELAEITGNKEFDVAVNTTIADAGPMMISEAMCNETPVIAFDRSIACDLCVDGETGYLIKNLNLQSMCDAIYDILFVDDIEKMSIQAREKYLEFHLPAYSVVLD